MSAVRILAAVIGLCALSASASLLADFRGRSRVPIAERCTTARVNITVSGVTATLWLDMKGDWHTPSLSSVAIINGMARSMGNVFPKEACLVHFLEARGMLKPDIGGDYSCPTDVGGAMTKIARHDMALAACDIFSEDIGYAY